MTALSTVNPLKPVAGRKSGRARSIAVRNLSEAGVMLTLILFGAFTLLTTVAIIYTLSHETWTFFQFKEVSWKEFFFGLRWSPLLGSEKHFGVWPLVAGTVMITVVAMGFAGPLGIITAIWLAEYAPRKLRNILKPVLEILAGVPTVVLGFFALTFITPALQLAFIQQPSLDADGQPLLDSAGQIVSHAWNPFGVDGYNVLAAGIAVGILTLPVVTSLTEDALRAVPRPLREGSYGLGATRFETSTRVVFPAALSGVIAAFLLAIARCVGETMIVALAAGGTHLPLYQITDPPLVMHDWHVAGDRVAGGAPVARLSDGQWHQTPLFAVGAEEKIDEVEVMIEPGASATGMKFELAEASGKVLHRDQVTVESADDGKGIVLVWRLQSGDANTRAAADAARDYGRVVDGGGYVVRVSPAGGNATIRMLNVEGETLMGLGARLSLPLDVRRSAQPMTGYLVQIFLGDVSNLGVEYYSSYAVAALLFAFTFVLTLVGHFIRVRFQQQYE